MASVPRYVPAPFPWSILAVSTLFDTPDTSVGSLKSLDPSMHHGPSCTSSTHICTCTIVAACFSATQCLRHIRQTSRDTCVVCSTYLLDSHGRSHTLSVPPQAAVQSFSGALALFHDVVFVRWTRAAKFTRPFPVHAWFSVATYCNAIACLYSHFVTHCYTFRPRFSLVRRNIMLLTANGVCNDSSTFS